MIFGDNENIDIKVSKINQLLAEIDRNLLSLKIRFKTQNF
jgi:hypothetical protein